METNRNEAHNNAYMYWYYRDLANRTESAQQKSRLNVEAAAYFDKLQKITGFSRYDVQVYLVRAEELQHAIDRDQEIEAEKHIDALFCTYRRAACG